MTNRVLKAYIKAKYYIKVKNTGYGYILLEQESWGADSHWKLHSRKVYMNLAEAIDDLEKEKK